MEVLLVASNTVVSAYKADETGSYAYSNTKAKTLFKRLQKGISWCTSKNNTPTPFPVLGAVNQHEFTKNKVEYFIKLHHGTLVDAEMRCKEFELHLDYVEKFDVPEGIPYVKETVVNDVAVVADEEEDLNNVPVRSVEEIALEKEDLTWLSKKKYYIVNDDETAEQLFTFLDNYNGMIAYDTETTGLKINCFGKINSDYSRTLEKYNMEHPKETIRADRLVGIIFCVEPDVSYYFPVFNRKFKNLYEDKNSPVRKKIIQNTKSRYTVGDLRDLDSDMARYVRETPEDEWRLDVILMERVRNILTTKHIATHGGIFEWRVGWMFEIDTNICDDSMIMHQLMYKFRSTTSNKGESSNLKFLAKHELGMDQWELKDFFPNLKEDDSGKARQGSNKKNSGSRIDFSYMDYAGTRVYAPADGDATLSLCLKYKKDMKENYPEIEYLYSVELLVSCAMGYVEFYGHRINEEKINSARLQTRANIAMLEEEIRQSIEYNSESETAAYNKLKELAKNGESESEDYDDRLDKAINELTEAIANNTDKVLNINSPAQVSELFFDKLKYPLSSDGSRSVSKKVYKALAKEVGEDGKPKYPVAGLYGKYKAETTLLQKFFGALPDFMYPDGMIFSDFGQISTATGRMSCKHPNAQQYPKVITKIVVPRKNCIMLDADYSQIEYRVLTALAHNDELAELFKDPDSDYHTLMASLMYETPYASVTPQMRSAAKSFNFGIPYGMGFGSLAILLHGTKTEANIADAKEKYELYFKNQPNTRRFFDNIKEQAQVYKYTETLFKRRRYYSFEDKDGNINNANKARALRQAGNATIQGCLKGDTAIQTKEYGIVQIQDVVNQHLHVWDGADWTEGDILYSGKKRKCIVTFSTGQQFVCSPTHKFLVKSHRGNERFVECQNLLTKENSKNYHRVVITRDYEPSDWVYQSDRVKYMTFANNSKNVFLDDIDDSFKIGVVLGRLSSDGNILHDDVKHRHAIRQIIAEHEMPVYDTLKEYMEPFGLTEYHTGIREGRTQDIIHLNTHSKSLTDEVVDLDIRHQIHPKIMQDTEMLRGFLRGLFDGDGGISGKTITLVFGTQEDFEPFCRQIQKALLFFGIRSRYYKYDYRNKITISAYDNQKFLDLIGFINPEKQEAGRELECVKDEHIFGKVLSVESVEITDEYIDMYDVCNTDGGYYVADGVITHNTAADIFKIGLARNFNFIRKNKLYGKMFIINLIHDEQLMEVDVTQTNPLKILAEVGNNMQFHVDGFPPLYIGAGVGPAWGYAKGKMAEIHPSLMDTFIEEAKNLPVLKEKADDTKPQDVIDWFQNRVYEFRRHKVIDYIVQKENWEKPLHPAIGSIVNLQFNYGRGDDARAYSGPNGEKYSDAEFLKMNLSDFIAENKLDIDVNTFFRQDVFVEEKVEESDDYDDGDDIEDFDPIEGIADSDRIFSLVDESDKTFGSSVVDLIDVFGACILNRQRICGIDMRGTSAKAKDNMSEYLCRYLCEPTDDGALQVIFLVEGNILNKTGVYVRGISGSEIEAQYKKYFRTSKNNQTGEKK